MSRYLVHFYARHSEDLGSGTTELTIPVDAPDANQAVFRATVILDDLVVGLDRWNPGQVVELNPSEPVPDIGTRASWGRP